MKYKFTRKGIARQDLAQDRAFWRDLLEARASLRGLPAHSAGGYRNRRFAIIRDAAWIALYCQIASNSDPLFASNRDPSLGAG